MTDDKWQVAKRGPRDIDVNVSWATGKFFPFFLIFNSTNNYFEQTTTCTTGDKRWMTNGEWQKGKRCQFWCLLVQVSFFSPPFHFFFTNSAIVLTKLWCTTASSPPTVHHYHLDTTTTSTYHHGQRMMNWGICWYFLFFFSFFLILLTTIYS